MRERSYEQLLHCYKLYDTSATKDSVRPKTINSLRDFRKERKKVTESKRSEASADHLCAPKLRHCGSLYFTADQEQPRRKVSNDTGIEDPVGEAQHDLR
jgi:hypothetical protein